MGKRPAAGRAVFYTRDSLGKHETTPGEYVLWARRAAVQYGVAFYGTPERIEAMIRSGRSKDNDLFLDYGVTGNQLSRPGLDALIQTALTDFGISHVLIPCTHCRLSGCIYVACTALGRRICASSCEISEGNVRSWR